MLTGEELFLRRCVWAPEHLVAVGVSAELFDDVAVLDFIIKAVFIAERFKQLHGFIMHFQAFRVHIGI